MTPLHPGDPHTPLPSELDPAATAAPVFYAPNGHHPPRTSVLAAVRRHPVLAALPPLAAVAAAAAFGLTRPPTYTAEAQLQVGDFNLSAPGALNGFSTASAALAAAYSRTVDADDVVRPIAKELGLSEREARARVTATPVPESPVFLVASTGRRERQAIGLANAAAEALVDHIRTDTEGRQEAVAARRAYRAATLRLEDARLDRETAVRRYRLRRSADRRLAVRDARARTHQVSLEVQTQNQRYENARQSQLSRAVPSIIAKASAADSDRRSRLQVLVFIALLVGVPAGVGLALVRAQSTRAKAG
jgi:capsular polysaccharide biosynthesis protein